MNVSKDGHLELSNNVAEQAQRIFVVGRRNWLFSGSPHGAWASATIYSVITTAKTNRLNPRLYVEWLLIEMSNAGKFTGEVVDSFPPQSDRVPESCKLDPAATERAKEMSDDFIINTDPDAFDGEMANNAEEGLQRHSGLGHTATQRWKRSGLFHPYAGMALDVFCYAVISMLTF